MSNSKETLAGILLLTFVILVCLFLGRNTHADLRGDGGSEPCRTPGHPLYTDC